MKSINRRYQQMQTGFGIIEIMIALALGVIIMLGVTQIASNNSIVGYELDRTGRQIETAAYALRAIESDLMNAGFWGEMGEQGVDEALPAAVPAGGVPVCPAQSCDPSVEEDLEDASCELNWALRFPVQGGMARVGTEDFPCATLDPDDLDGDSDAAKITPKLETDYLAIRRANSCALGDPGCDTADGNFHLQVHACFTPGVDTAPLPGIAYALDTIDSIPDTSIFKYKLRGVDCGAAPAAPHYRLLNIIYYINDDDQLIRAELVGNEYVQSTLAEGIEMMRVEYGVDRNGDGQVDDDVNGYTPDPTTDLATNTPDAFPEDWADVVMARVSLVVRNTESSGYMDDKVYTISGQTYCADDPGDSDIDPDDGPCDLMDIPAAFEDHRRQVYSRTVGLRNVAGRREVQP